MSQSKVERIVRKLPRDPERELGTRPATAKADADRELTNAELNAVAGGADKDPDYWMSKP